LVRQLQRRRRLSRLEKARAFPENQRVDHQHQLVDKPVPHQRAQQLAAAEHDQRLVMALLELAHCLSGIAGKQRRILPARLIAAIMRGDEFPRTGQRPGHRTGRLSDSPGFVEILIGRPAGEQ
jgi:hypothetical protein